MSKKGINLALQGGGSHGAFTWGVLDALLEDQRLDVQAISGASAGAMNAVVCADGLMEGGEARAREKLAAFWRGISTDGSLAKPQREILDAFFRIWDPMNLRADMLENASTFMSPYQANPLDVNPLRDVLTKTVNFERLRETNHLKLFIGATNVRTGRVHIFRRPELTADMVMASACIPTIFKAVEIKDQFYWDGGYSGNPALFPFFTETEAIDIILVQVNPIMRSEVPRTPRTIMNRLNEITFNSPLMGEFRAVDFVTRLIEENRLEGTHYKKIRMHLIEGGEELAKFEADTKAEANFNFLEKLFHLGRKAARAFLDKDYDSIGVKATFDIRGLLVPDS